MSRRKSQKQREEPIQDFGKKLLYNLEEAGALLSLSSWTVRDYVKTGVIKAAKVPHPFNPHKFLSKPILIHRDELESFAEKCRSKEVA
ncbi:helix-turn-helix domain-containing protein [bacterium]|nr:helix-turn-helix domain-containing protein [bacterium]